MRETGLEVDDTPKIHAESPMIKTHSIYDDETEIRIPLQLDGIFSGFKTRALTAQEKQHPEEYDVIFLTPDAESWTLIMKHMLMMRISS